MTPELAIDILKNMIFQAVILAMPLLITALCIGLLVSLFQAVTSISEHTLTFVPKAIGVIAVLIILLPWFVRTLIDYTTAIIEKMPDMLR
jgi:flagellar biosynthetic protein FliQ